MKKIKGSIGVFNTEIATCFLHAVDADYSIKIPVTWMDKWLTVKPAWLEKGTYSVAIVSFNKSQKIVCFRKGDNPYDRKNIKKATVIPKGALSTKRFNAANKTMEFNRKLLDGTIKFDFDVVSEFKIATSSHYLPTGERVFDEDIAIKVSLGGDGLFSTTIFDSVLTIVAKEEVNRIITPSDKARSIGAANASITETCNTYLKKPLDDEFWAVWRHRKEDIKEAGYRVKKVDATFIFEATPRDKSDIKKNINPKTPYNGVK